MALSYSSSKQRTGQNPPRRMNISFDQMDTGEPYLLMLRWFLFDPNRPCRKIIGALSSSNSEPNPTERGRFVLLVAIAGGRWRSYANCNGLRRLGLDER